MINHYKDSCSTTSITESQKVFLVAQMCHPFGSIVQKTGEERSFNNKKPAGNTKSKFCLNLALLEKKWYLDYEGSKDGANELHPSFDQHILDHGKRNMALKLKTLFLSSRP